MGELIDSFFLGGALIGGTRYISGIIGPEYAALVGGLPTGLITPFFLDNDKKRELFLWGYLMDAIAMSIILVEIYYMLNYTELSGQTISGIAFISWATISIALLYHAQRHK